MLAASWLEQECEFQENIWRYANATALATRNAEERSAVPIRFTFKLYYSFAYELS